MSELKFDELRKILPQRFPFLLIDRVTEVDPGKRAVAYKNITLNDWFLQGHYPQDPVVPETLIIEMMAQASILLYHSGYKADIKEMPEYYLGSINAKFEFEARPGDQLKIVSETVKLLQTGAFVNAKAFVGETKIGEADLIFAVKR
ncbi:MAG: 3-hydroxyacyl-ACP dehydratase FabZ [Candidatus Omnitrophica bacterium]|nr:3-hydroxyacyl-ACP dehydratase FabZ [Candidatus Omnitrophota bacterium]MBU1869929.1 3-hydroxyacyl-ACP dehydratase FabZ [Candidatus Omnitrophota bacterium]